VDATNNKKAQGRVRIAVEKAKWTLLQNTMTSIELEQLHEGRDMNVTLTRARMEDLSRDLFDRCIAILEKFLKDANMDKKSVDEIVLVGGSTRIEKLQRMLKGMRWDDATFNFFEKNFSMGRN
jgi:molecular chaperone DnaK (HSP70)